MGCVGNILTTYMAPIIVTKHFIIFSVVVLLLLSDGEKAIISTLPMGSRGREAK